MHFSPSPGIATLIIRLSSQSRLTPEASPSSTKYPYLGCSTGCTERCIRSYTTLPTTAHIIPEPERMEPTLYSCRYRSSSSHSRPRLGTMPGIFFSCPCSLSFSVEYFFSAFHLNMLSQHCYFGHHDHVHNVSSQITPTARTKATSPALL